MDKNQYYLWFLIKNKAVKKLVRKKTESEGWGDTMASPNYIIIDKPDPPPLAAQALSKNELLIKVTNFVEGEIADLQQEIEKARVLIGLYEIQKDNE